MTIVRKVFKRWMSPQFMTLNIGDVSGDLRRLGNVLSNVSCIKDEWQFRRLGRQYCQSYIFYCGQKWIQRIASIWRAKLSGESELPATEVLRVGATRGSGHVCPGKLNRPPLPSGGRRRMWNIRRRWNVGRIELQLWDIPDKVERWSGRILDVRHPGGVSDDFHPGGMSYATRRKGAVYVSKGEEATWHFLVRIPQ